MFCRRVGPLKISHVDLTGVGAALAKHSGDGSQYKGVKAHFQMDDSGILSLLNAELIVEKTSSSDDQESAFSKLSSSLTKFFSGSEEASPNQTKGFIFILPAFMNIKYHRENILMHYLPLRFRLMLMLSHESILYSSWRLNYGREYNLKIVTKHNYVIAQFYLLLHF